MKLYRSVCLFFCLLISQVTLAQGLKFLGGEQAIDKRTSYTVFASKSPVFEGRMEIAFDLALYPAWEIGYILRIKNEQSDVIYNLFYDGQGDDLIFRLNQEGKSSLVMAQIDPQELQDMRWVRMKIAFDMVGDSISLTIHDKTFAAGNAGLPHKYHPQIIFGKSDHIIDVPSVAIKNLSVGDRKKYLFSLREHEGTTVYDSEGRPRGEVSNPEWLINDAYHWRFLTSFASESVAGTNYDPRRKEVYYFNREAISTYNVRSGEIQTRAFAGQCPVRLQLGMNFIDPRSGKLYAYEVYNDTPPLGGVMVASLDLASGEWTPEASAQLPTQLHHHGAFFAADSGRYTIFGGFGNMHFSKEFHTFDTDSCRWDTLGGFSGDPLFPRYFSSVGYLKKNNSVYVFGGMGNESGEQVVGRNYFYDLHRVDLTTNRVTKLWEIPWSGENVVPVRGMVILDDENFYTLCYPESRSDSFLRLYRFSIADGSYEILGDSIPIHSDKITTNANLYYDAQLNNLYATVQEFEDDIISDMKVYSLAFPPITAEQLENSVVKAGNGGTLVLVLVFGCLCLVAVFFVIRKLRSQLDEGRVGIGDLDKLLGEGRDPARPNSVYLYGDFMVRDRHNKDITYMFSTRLKQTLCLVLQYSAEEGIPSQKLSNLLWPDKPEDKVKNSRGVTINHLRKTLSELDGVELIHDKGYFRIVSAPGFYCDYIRSLEILGSSDPGAHREELVRILKRGKFLKFSDQPIFDSFKQAEEHRLEPILQLELEKSFAQEEYQMTITLADALFNIDPLNEDALTYQIKALQKLKLNEEARLRYQSFANEYKKTFGTECPHSF